MLRTTLFTVLALASPAAADLRDALRSPPELTVRLGASLPMFVVYEFPGPWAQLAAGWRLGERTQLFAAVGVGVLAADGARRYTGSLDAGVRFAPWRSGPWAQLGLGTTGFVEKIGVVFPERMVSATDLGIQATANIAVGVQVLGWEFGVGYDHIIAPLPYYQNYTGSESLPHRGTALAWFGRQL